MKKGSVVLVGFTGSDMLTGKVFDTTDEEEAKKAGVFDEKGIYRKVPLIVGAGDIIKGIADAVEQMEEGEKKTIEIEPKDGFGERNPKLIAIMPIREFRERKMEPFPGMVIDVDGRKGRVQSVSGGRVRVDFNPELAGRTVKYDLKVEKEITDKAEQVKALAGKYFAFLDEDDIKVKIEGKEAEVILPPKEQKSQAIIKPIFSKIIVENLDGVEKLKYIEEYSKEKPKKSAQKE